MHIHELHAVGYRRRQNRHDLVLSISLSLPVDEKFGVSNICPRRTAHSSKLQTFLAWAKFCKAREERRVIVARGCRRRSTHALDVIARIGMLIIK